MKINICPEFGDLLLFTPNSITRECFSSPWSRLRPKPEGRTESVAHGADWITMPRRRRLHGQRENIDNSSRDFVLRWCQLQTITCWTDKTTYVCYAFISKCCYMHLRQNGYPEKKTPTQTRQAHRRSTKQRQPMSWQKDFYQSWQRFGRTIARPPCSRAEFREFLTQAKCGNQHVASLPYHPQSNGFIIAMLALNRPIQDSLPMHERTFTTE
ncbi:hypothetical protein T12_16443 [Trichinella patagoniensis]|uniref:Uncharacterized protein n=1 Tax=Trichinella patagoniensis TaxID=990121 RepID=A0A0V0ZWE9_9BILA|nr:hypothetical protein T12_16443 [Trichinella patagoniensis]